MEFILDNLVWFILATTSGLALLWPYLSGASGMKKLTPQEAVQLMSHDSLLVIDVRSKAEYAAGHIMRARNFPLDELAESITRLNKYKQKPVLVYCQSDARASKAYEQLKKAGYTQLYHLNGGIDAWSRDHLPLVK